MNVRRGFRLVPCEKRQGTGSDVLLVLSLHLFNDGHQFVELFICIAFLQGLHQTSGHVGADDLAVGLAQDGLCLLYTSRCV